jgi:UDP-N-acetylglucosamine 2-epimerase (non-hydrolysing)
VRENTERPVTVTCGTNVIAGTRTEDILEAVRSQRHRQWSGIAPEKWDGKAGTRIIETLVTEATRQTNRQIPAADPVLR